MVTIAWRRKQLLTLKQMLTKHKKEFQEALYKDLGKHYTEASCTEIVTLEGEIDYFIASLSKLMQSKQVPSPAVLLPAFSTLEPRPLSGPGCLVIGPSNYPVLLSLKPVAGSLAAGNPTVLKPSELSSAVSQLLHRLVTQYFDAAAFCVVQGGVSETNALLKESWGLVFFTGSSRVGKIVAACAAMNVSKDLLATRYPDRISRLQKHQCK
jgi:acyl-CoA reductase-like NAD-dependent aldehyde dehydrogenase